MNILLLGGTGFLGAHIARAALTRGHKVTCLARGTNPPIDGVRFVKGDRDTETALNPVADDSWDSVIDLTSQPKHASRVVEQLTDGQAIFVSSSSVYADPSVINAESDEIVPPLQDDFMVDMQQYAAAKAACEKAYLTAFPKVLVIRPGLIGGAGDVTGRSGYYPWRFANPVADEVVVPDPSFPVAMIDAQDLADWIVRCAENRADGVVNVAGEPTTLAEVLAISQKIAGNGAQPRVVNDQMLSEHGVSPWMGPESLPLWIPGTDLRKIALLDRSLAVGMGLKIRSLGETLVSALNYERQRVEPRQTGLSDTKEREILSAPGAGSGAEAND